MRENRKQPWGKIVQNVSLGVKVNQLKVKNTHVKIGTSHLIWLWSLALWYQHDSSSLHYDSTFKVTLNYLQTYNIAHTQIKCDMPCMAKGTLQSTVICVKGSQLECILHIGYVYCYLEFKLRYLKDLTLFSIRVRIYDPIVLQKKNQKN